MYIYIYRSTRHHSSVVIGRWVVSPSVLLSEVGVWKRLWTDHGCAWQTGQSWPLHVEFDQRGRCLHTWRWNASQDKKKLDFTEFL